MICVWKMVSSRPTVLLLFFYCVQPEGNLAMDRFKSMQRRNMIEPRQIVKWVHINNITVQKCVVRSIIIGHCIHVLLLNLVSRPSHLHVNIHMWLIIYHSKRTKVWSICWYHMGTVCGSLTSIHGCYVKLVQSTSQVEKLEPQEMNWSRTGSIGLKTRVNWCIQTGQMGEWRGMNAPC